MGETNRFPSNLKYLRISNNKTMKQIANYVNKTEATISRWESKERDVTMEDACKIAEYFNVPIDDLILKDLSNSTFDLDVQIMNKIKFLDNTQKQKVIDMIDIIRG